MIKGYDDNQKYEKFLIITTGNYVEQTFTYLQINQTLAQERQFTPIWKVLYTNSLLLLE